MYGGWFVAVLLLVAVPVVVLAVAAWLITSISRSPEETAIGIAKERFVRGEIDKEQLGVLLNAL
jgi:uncharacterized membrane protein